MTGDTHLHYPSADGCSCDTCPARLRYIDAGIQQLADEQSIINMQREIDRLQDVVTRVRDILRSAGCEQLDGCRPTCNDTNVVNALLDLVSRCGKKP